MSPTGIEPAHGMDGTHLELIIMGMAHEYSEHRTSPSDGPRVWRKIPSDLWDGARDGIGMKQ